MTGERPFRFFDNREKYLLFVTTCSEKWAIGQRIGAELPTLEPAPPALRVFDAGTGDGTVMASVLRQLHGHFPTVPFLVVGKEISLEDVSSSRRSPFARGTTPRSRCGSCWSRSPPRSQRAGA